MTADAMRTQNSFQVQSNAYVVRSNNEGNDIPIFKILVSKWTPRINQGELP